MDCHNKYSRRKIQEIMTIHKKNVYTIEKHGRKKIIYQTPWMDGDIFKGIMLVLGFPDFNFFPGNISFRLILLIFG
jgi:hypothetical protein